MGLSQLPFLGWTGRGCSKLLSISSIGSQVGRGQELPSASAVNQYFCLCSMPGSKDWLCSGGMSSTHQPLLSEHHLVSPSGHMEPEDTFHSRWVCDSAPSLGVGKLGVRASQTFRFRIYLRQISTSLVPRSKCTTDLNEQNH